MVRALLNRIRYRRFERDIVEELAFHRDMKAREGVLNVDRAMGNELRMRELSRDVWIRPRLDALLQDTRNALRAMMRRPAFTATVAATLAVGVTVSIAALSVLDSLLLRPLPVNRPDRLVYLRDPAFSFKIIRDVRALRDIFPSSFAWNITQGDVRWSDEPQSTLIMLASGEIYETLGVRAAIGRLLTSADDGRSESDAPPVAVLSFVAWQRRFGGDPTVVGRTLQIDETQVTIVGVTAPGFNGISPGRAPEITIPVTLAPRLRTRDLQILVQPTGPWLHFMARLPDGVALAAADAAFQVAWRRVLEATTPADETPERRARFLSRASGLEQATTGYSAVRNQFRQPMLVIVSFAGLLLILTCATVANMLVAGTSGRSREVAVRMALGCGRVRLCRQLLIEGVVLAGIASGLALALAPASSRALVALVTTAQAPVTIEVGVDGRLFALALSLVMATAVAFSVAPILVVARVDPGPTLKTGARESAGQGRWLGRTLVSAQIACSVVLLIGAGLFIRSLTHVLALDAGFSSQDLVALRIPGPRNVRDVLEHLTATRGVQSAAASVYPPISDRDGSWTRSVGIDGAAPSEDARATYFNAVSPGFFSTLGTTVLSGRDFSWGDAAGSQRVAILNASAGRRFFGDRNPIGHRITVGLHPSRRDLTIVGVVADAKYQRLQEEQRDIVYLPFLQGAEAIATDVLFASVRVAPSDDALRQLRMTVAEAIPGENVRLERVVDRIRDSLVTERALASIAFVLAGCAVFLSCVGVFGLVAHLVARRTREIGIRIALGARAAQVLRHVVAQTLAMASAGLIAGIVVALLASRSIAGLLHAISVTDPISYALTIALTIVSSLVAGWLPARRAASVNPMTALRTD
jgi:putative ABC transport system permease protein